MAATRTQGLIDKPGLSITSKANAALANTKSEHRFVTEDAANADCIVLSSADDHACGVIYQFVDAKESVPVIVAGIVTIEIGAGGLLLGDPVNAGAAGVAIKALAGKPNLGRCLVGGAAGEMGSVQLGLTPAVLA